MFWKKKQPNFAKQLAIEPPVPDKERHGVAIGFLVKNEAPNLVEWIRFHRMVGVRKFFAYDDGSDDKTVETIRSTLPEADHIVIPWRNPHLMDPRNRRFISNQVFAYAHAISNYGSEFRWMAFIDVDEFIIPMSSPTIEKSLAVVNGFPNVSLPWHMFGRSGHVKPPKGGVLNNYIQRAPDPMSPLPGVMNFKCIVDPCRVSEVSLHGFRTTEFDDITCNDVGDRFTLTTRKSPSFYSAKNLKLHHYYTRSDEELQRKLNRGSASPVSDDHHVERVMRAVENIERDSIEDLDAVNFVQSHSFS